MTHLLAIDTATDALSIALAAKAGVRVSHRIMPRRHQQQLFAALDELLAGETFADLGLDAIVYGRGPGSFTGLRIAVSAAQGLGFSLGVPLIGISSLETQARTLLRTESISQPCVLLSSIDARIGQVYAREFFFDGGRLQALGDTMLASPDALSASADRSQVSQLPVYGLGSGYALREAMSPSWGELVQCWPDVLPEAEDMLEPARILFDAGDVTLPAEATPDYVQRGSTWKTLAEQGRKA